MPKKGEAVREDVKARISATKIDAFLSSLSERSAEPDKKRCTRCEEFKPVSDFHLNRVNLRSGVVAIRPEPQCKVCKATLNKARRDRRKAEGNPVPGGRRSRTRAREYRREWEAAKRREEGARLVGARLAPTGPDSNRLSSEPLVAFLRKEVESRTLPSVAAATGVDERRITGILRREYPTITLAVVDRIVTGLGCPEEMHFLYPEDEPPPAGYQYLPSNQQEAA